MHCRCCPQLVDHWSSLAWPEGAAAASPGFQRAVVLQLGGSEQKDLLGWINQPCKGLFPGQSMGGRGWTESITVCFPLLSWDLYLAH